MRQRLICFSVFSNDWCWESERRSLKSSTTHASNETTWSIPNPNLHQRHYILENLYSFMDVTLSSNGVLSSSANNVVVQSCHVVKYGPKFPPTSILCHACCIEPLGSALPTPASSCFSGKVPVMGSMTSSMCWSLAYIQEDSASI
jgi:hypothetical protein